MELKFLGIGSAFQTKLCNTSAFFVEDDVLFLIDCGETTFEQLKAQNFFKDIEEIYVVFTHTHSDHIGGIAKLINYSYDVLEKPLTIIIPSEDEFYEDILTLLDIFSISKDKYDFILPYQLTNVFNEFNSITFLPTSHAPELKGKCYSLVFSTANGNVLYSGDSTDTKYIERLVCDNFTKMDNFNKMYIDVTLSIPEAHLDLNILEKIVPKKLRHKVFCMHFDSIECLNKAKEMGFNIAISTFFVDLDLSTIPLSFEYKKSENNLLLSNCNEICFMQLQHNNLLDGVDTIYLVIENTDPESVAGLGSLLTYSHFVLKKPIYICNNDIKEKMLKLARIYGTNEDSLSFNDDNTKYFFNSKSDTVTLNDGLREFDIILHSHNQIPAIKNFEASEYFNSGWMPLIKGGEYIVTTANGNIGYHFEEQNNKYVFIRTGDVILEFYPSTQDVFIYQIEKLDKNSKKAICKLLAYSNLNISKSITSNENVDLSKYLNALKALNGFLMYPDKVTGA